MTLILLFQLATLLVITVGVKSTRSWKPSEKLKEFSEFEVLRENENILFKHLTLPKEPPDIDNFGKMETFRVSEEPCTETYNRTKRHYRELPETSSIKTQNKIDKDRNDTNDKLRKKTKIKSSKEILNSDSENDDFMVSSEDGRDYDSFLNSTEDVDPVVKVFKGPFVPFIDNYCGPVISEDGTREDTCRVSGKCLPYDLFRLETCALCYQYIPEHLFVKKFEVTSSIIRRMGREFVVSFLFNGTHLVSVIPDQNFSF